MGEDDSMCCSYIQSIIQLVFFLIATPLLLYILKRFLFIDSFDAFQQVFYDIIMKRKPFFSALFRVNFMIVKIFTHETTYFTLEKNTQFCLLVFAR